MAAIVVILCAWVCLNIACFFAIQFVYKEHFGVKASNFRVAWQHVISDIRDDKNSKALKAFCHFVTICILPFLFLIASISGLVSQK